MERYNLTKIMKNNLDKTGNAPSVTKTGLPNKKGTLPLISSTGYMEGVPPNRSHYRIPSDTLYNPTPFRIKATPNKGASKWLEPYDTSNTTFPEADYVDEQHYQNGGNYISDKAKATQFGQYKRGGGMFPPYHSFTPPREDDGGDISIPNLQEGWLKKYQIAGQTGFVPMTNRDVSRGATESTSRVFNTMNGPVNTGTTGYNTNTVKKTAPVKPIANFKPVNSRTIMGKNVSDKTQVAPLFDARQNANINADSDVSKQQQQVLINAGQSPSAARFAVNHKQLTGNQQEILDNNAAYEYRVTKHPDYDPTKSIKEQFALADDNSLATRIGRGSRSAPSNSDSYNAVWDMMSAPGKGFNNLVLEGPKHYEGQGWTAPLNAGLDVISMAPGVGGYAASGVRNMVGKQVLGSMARNAEMNLLKNAGVNLAKKQLPALKELGHHLYETVDEGIKHKFAHAGVHAAGPHEEINTDVAENIKKPIRTSSLYTNPSNTNPVKLKQGGWLNKYI
jgi:hypothetical protein